MKKIAVIMALLHGMAWAQAEGGLTLPDAIRIGREKSRTLLISAARIAAAQGKSGAADALLLPALKLEASYKHLSDVPPFSIQPPGFPKPFVVSPNVLDNYSVRVSLQEPLFTGFRLSSNSRAAGALEEASRLDNLNDEDDVVLLITTAYWALYQTLETQKAMDENVKRLESYVQDSQNLLKAGMATRNDLLKIQVQYNNARLQQIDAANDVQVATMTLNNAMGRPLDTPVTLASVPAVQSSGQAPGQAAQSIAEAFQRRSDIRAMTARVEASRSGVTAARSGWWPQLMLGANYYYSKPNIRYQPALAEFKDSWDVGLTLQFDVWNWGLAGHETEQAEAALHQNEVQLDQMKENIALDVRRQSLAVTRAREKVTVASTSVEQAEENLRSMSDKFKNGLATSSDLLDADFAQLQARTTLTGALVERELADARLRRAIGRSEETQ